MGKQKVTISIVVPVYNAEQFIHRCIDSILNQTYADFELLLIDDGSKDCSGIICDEYAVRDSRVRVFHKENGGVYAARMDGISLSTGDYILFVDADDLLKIKDSLFEVFPFLDGCEVAITGMPKDEHNVSGMDYRRDLMSGKVRPSIWARFFRCDIIKSSVLDVPRDIVYGEDWLMNLMVSLHVERCVYLSCDIYDYQINDSSVSKRFVKTYTYEKKFYSLLKNIFIDNIDRKELEGILFFYYKGFLNACKNIAIHARYIDFKDEIWDSIRYTKKIYSYNLTDKVLLYFRNKRILQLSLLTLWMLNRIKVTLGVSDKASFYK